MNVEVGAGWRIHHYTDRVIELRKPDVLYHRFTGRPGYVRVRGEPGSDRKKLLDDAMRLAEECDDRITQLATQRLLPALHQVAAMQGKQVRLRRAFATPEDPEVIGVKRA